MKPEFESFMKLFEAEVDATANEYFKMASSMQGIKGYSALKALCSIRDINVEKAYLDHQRLVKAFSTLSIEKILEEYRGEEYKDTKKYEVNETELDSKKKLFNTTFTEDEVREFAIAVLTDNRDGFYNTLLSHTQNKRLSKRYTKIIFGSAPKNS